MSETVKRRYIENVCYTWYGLASGEGEPNTVIWLDQWLDHFGGHPVFSASVPAQRMFNRVVNKIKDERGTGKQAAILEEEWIALVGKNEDGITQIPGEDFGWPVFAVSIEMDENGQPKKNAQGQVIHKPVPSPRNLDLFFADALVNATSEPRQETKTAGEEIAVEIDEAAE